MKMKELISNLVTVYHKRKEILKNKELDIPGIGVFIKDGDCVINKDRNQTSVISIRHVNRTKYKEPSIYIFLPGNSITVKKLKDGNFILTRLVEKRDIQIPVPTEYDEYFNFSLQNNIPLSFDEIQHLCNALKQINHPVAIKLWN